MINDRMNTAYSSTARLATVISCAWLLAASAGSIVRAEQPAALGFNEHIRPLLAEHCLACHGPDPETREADLRLDTQEGAMAGGVIVAGLADESELVARILSEDPEYQMPPPGSEKPLDEKQKAMLVRWINEGAHWQKHWSFISPQRPPPPPDPAGWRHWVRNPIDQFILAELQRRGLTPNEPAERHTLARRAALDITGLPPTDEQLQYYLNDSSDGAFSHYVDLLLQSPHAGEHRARYWLDAARYGDTHGMHVDNYREIWPYREWVIRAFNRNMPFDQFVVEQIAGDLLPGATLDQQIATGFSRCNITTSEGGAIPEELDARYMVDRVETTATVFLALTAGCAVCHDHKYDPITQREFYQLGAFFNNTTQPAMDGNMKDTPPVVVLPAKEFQQEWDELQVARAELRSQLRSEPTGVAAWWAAGDQHPSGGELHPVASDQLAVFLPLSEGEAEWPPLPATARWANDHPRGHRGMRFAQAGDLQIDFPQVRSDEPLSVSFWLRTPDVVTGTTKLEQTRKTDDDKTIGWKISSNTANALTFEMSDGRGGQIRGVLPDNEALRPRQWQHVCVRYSGGQSNSSISILADGRAAALRNSTEALIEAVPLAEAALQVAGSLPTAAISDVRLYRRWLSDEEVKLLANDSELLPLLKSPRDWSQLDQPLRQLITSYYQQVIDEDYRLVSRRLAATTQRRDFIYSRSTTTLVMEERPGTPRAWVLERGDYQKRKEQVSPGLPAALPQLPGNSPRDRLGLARWLTDPTHPLVSRVTVNRLWQSVFGVGLVKTSEDFGVMGDRPSHPELLDWLAVEFVESGWNVNHLLKLMVTSAAYRQRSAVTPEKLAADPENRYLSRGPRYRLDAELLRDQALAVSGLLRRDIGGPSVKPYQPGGLWNVVAITGSNTREFKRDSGDALYRRSLYTFWKRTAPPPSMAAFNAPTREQCTVRRERTNTPLQALVMMNDVQFVEAARILAQHTLHVESKDQDRAARMLWTVLRRPASPQEIEEIQTAAQRFYEIFQQSPEEASKLVTGGDAPIDEGRDASELAAWTMVANTMLNRDDFINK